MRVLVAGATGYLGRHMVAELKKSGHWVRVLSRRQDAFARGTHHPDEVFVGEATRPESLKGLCDGIDVVVSSLGQTRQKDKLSFWEIDYGANKTILDLAVAAGARQFVFISVVRPDLTIDLDIVAAREALIRDMRATPITGTVVRATGFFSDMSEFLDMARSGRVWLIGDGSNRINPVHGADVAEAVIGALGKDAREVEIGGPDVLSYQQIGALAFEVLGAAPKFARVPRWVVKIVLVLLRRINQRQYTTFAFLSRMMQNDIEAARTGRRHLRDEFQARAKTWAAE